MEPAGSGVKWTGSPKGVFAGRKHHKPRLALNNNTAGVCERKDANRSRIAGHLDEIQGVVAISLNGARGKRCDIDGQAKGRMSGSERVNLFRNGAVGFIDWLDLEVTNTTNACMDHHDNSVQLRQQTKRRSHRLDAEA
jgi:hypothetical protein